MARAGSTSEVAFAVENLNQVLRALSKIDKDLQGDVRDASVKIADEQVSKSQSAAHTPLQHLAASGIRAKRDRIPAVFVGRSKVSASTNSPRLTDIFYGAEFGGGSRPTTRHFPPHRGRRGYFFYPTLRANSARYFDLWGKAVDDAFEEWGERSTGVSPKWTPDRGASRG